jgi:hypothetical protein
LGIVSQRELFPFSISIVVEKIGDFSDFNLHFTEYHYLNHLVVLKWSDKHVYNSVMYIIYNNKCL